MRGLRSAAACALLLMTCAALGQRGYLGFDKDGYPGDDALPALHKTFAFTGYWLNNPPGMQSNPWVGKRGVVRAAGFGFLLVFNGRVDAHLQHVDAAALGRGDGADAVAAARTEGFPAGAVIFLDQEEGGALLPEQAAYMGSWIAAVRSAGFGAGVYASGIPVAAGEQKMSTAQDVKKRFPGVKLWVWDDRCPPAPGCVTAEPRFGPGMSSYPTAKVWQYALSPRRPQDSAACARTYASDHQCYAPGLPHSDATFIDVDVSDSADPSRGR
ncbi:MAG TPA: glycoside hydrolase domain-containing protein [Acidobacteriaceae bacterium]|jgi:hypothetical protein|nr:glycoside hydrolase domain-containing protein [Acidobacteriaceae bacterium]